MTDIKSLSETIISAAPTLTNIETATTVLTAATLVVTAVALSVAVIACIGFFVIKRSAEKIAQKAAERALSVDVQEYLNGQEFSNKLKILVESVMVDHIRNRIGSGAEDTHGGPPQPMEDIQ